MGAEKILLVDDENNLTNAFRRQLSHEYEVISASSGSEALALMQKSPNISVIVSDMSMPQMAGSEFLREAAKLEPDAIRVMLTGLVDQKTAVKAINEGAVFRFMTKPCSVEEFERTIKQCVQKHHLQVQERQLLQNTLGGVIGLVTDLISFIDPDGVQRAIQLRAIVKELCGSLSVPCLEVELATMFASIGKLALPLELLLKVSHSEPLNAVEEKLLAQSVQTSARLIKHIPRLEKVSLILEAVSGGPVGNGGIKSGVLAFRVAEKVLIHHQEGARVLETLAKAKSDLTKEELEFVSPLLQLPGSTEMRDGLQRFEVTFGELCPGQRLLEDVVDLNGKLLLKRGFLVSESVIMRIKNHHEMVGVKMPFVVNERIPTRSS